MTPKWLITIGVIWFMVVVVWLHFAPSSYFHMFETKDADRQSALIVGIYLFGLLYSVFIVGWLVPLALGTYRLVRHR